MTEESKLAMTHEEIDEIFARPTPGALETLKRLEGDVMLLGVAGKMGLSTALMLRRGFDELGKKNRVIGVSRFSDAESRERLESYGVTTIRADLIERNEVDALPDAANVLFLAGHKFGAGKQPDLSWAMNAVVPAYVADRYKGSRIVAFSTGCVYPFVPVDSPGSTEEDEIGPVGDYANSCVGRERVFTYFSRKHGTPVALFRLNYAIDLRYGVLVDIAQKVMAGEPVDVSTGHVNIIWQGDAIARSLQCFDHAASPPFVINVTGPEVVKVRDLANRFGEILGKEVRITGTESPTAWLSNPARSLKLFGPLTVGVDEMVQAVADHVGSGGPLLDKPTHFESRSGKF